LEKVSQFIEEFKKKHKHCKTYPSNINNLENLILELNLIYKDPYNSITLFPLCGGKVILNKLSHETVSFIKSEKKDDLLGIIQSFDKNFDENKSNSPSEKLSSKEYFNKILDVWKIIANKLLIVLDSLERGFYDGKWYSYVNRFNLPKEAMHPTHRFFSILWGNKIIFYKLNI
jgi:hypothetical protein